MSKERGNRSDDKEGDRKTLGDRLREAREYLGFSQDEVAKYLGAPRSALSLMETGQRKVEVIELKKLASLYKKSVSYFTDEEAPEPTFGAGAQHIARKVAELSPDDLEELGKFAEYLQARKQKKGE
jgi:transcriptional regulator with XRE-family HTH domain